jgi:HAE1 family hydrophobic/amphiphilic exporter-1
MGLTKTAITRPVFILMLMIAAVLLGYMSYSGMRKEQNPDIALGVVTVVTSYPGASPDEVNSLVSRKVEQAVSGINDLREVTATSQEGVSIVVANFNVGANMDAALSDVRSKVDAIANQLPTDTLKPTITKVNGLSGSTVSLVVQSSKMSNKDLRDLADDKLHDMFGQINGVAEVDVNGGDVRELQVRIHKDKLLAYGVGIADIQRAVNQATQNVPSGHFDTGAQQYDVRVLGEFKTPQELANMTVGIQDPENPQLAPKTIKLSNIADVVDSTAERSTYSRLNGADVVSISIQKAKEGNAIEISEAADGVIAQIQKLYGLTVIKTYDESKNIKDSLSDLQFALMFGIFLVASIVFVFLHNLRGTIIVAIAIPVCLISSFVAMNLLGFTVNNMSMLALSLAIGVLVDDAIVVLENIYRHLRMGEDPREAAINGRSEIGLAAIAITMADVVVFVPIGFMGGIVGEFFKPLALSFAATVLLSLFVSFTVTPMLAARWYRAGEDMEHPKGGFARWFEAMFHRLENFYRRVLEWALAHRWFVFITGFVVLGAVIMILVGSTVPPKAPTNAVGPDADPGKFGFAGAMKAGMMPAMLALAIGFIAFGVNFFKNALGDRTRTVLARVVLAASGIAFLFGFAKGGFGMALGMCLMVGLGALAVGGVLAFVPNLFLVKAKSRLIFSAMAFALVFPLAAMVGFAWAQYKGSAVLGFQFIPNTDQGTVSVSVELPPDANLAATTSVVKRIEAIVAKDPDVKYVLSQVGTSSSGQVSSLGANKASINVTLYDRAAPTDKLPWKHHTERLRTRLDTSVAADLTEAIGRMPGAQIKVSASGAGFGSPIQMSFQGEDRELLVNTVSSIVDKLRGGAIQGVINPDISSRPGVPELRVIPDRTKLAQTNLNVALLGQVARIMYTGNNDTKFRVNGREYDIRVMLDYADRNDPNILSTLPIAFSQGNPIFVGSLASITQGVGVDKIDRRNRSEEVQLTADLLPGYAAGTVQLAINNWIEKDKLVPKGVNLKPLGQADFQNREQGNLFIAMGLGFLLVYMLLASLYDNLLYPLIIQLAQPQAIVGALLALMLTNQQVNIVGMIGIITLIGLVGKNAILVVDYTNTLRGRGRSRHDALVEAGPTRLRPIMMTTLALILGISPVAMAFGRGSEFRQTIGIAIIGGISLSTVLTLVVIPCTYTILDDFSNYLGDITKRSRRNPPSEPDDFRSLDVAEVPVTV